MAKGNIMRSLFSAALCAAVLAYAGTAAAATVGLHHMFPDAPASTKRVASLKELRNANVIFQTQDYSCGAAALATLLRFGYGFDLDEEKVIRGMLATADADTVAREGFSMLDMKRYAESLGLRARGFQASIDDLQRLKVPVLALLDIDGYAHFVLIRGSNDGRVRLLDPAAGARAIPLQRFRETWNGVVLAVIGPQFQQQGLLARDDAWQSLKPQTAAQLRGLPDAAHQFELPSGRLF
jgi:predicted double-glycine peptidase